MMSERRCRCCRGVLDLVQGRVLVCRFCGQVEPAGKGHYVQADARWLERRRWIEEILSALPPVHLGDKETLMVGGDDGT